jgi:hypothetical protein
MNTSRFDSVSRLFAERRLSRRRVLAQGGLAAGALAASHVTSISAQEATPESMAGAAEGSTLFVQSFQSGSVAPKDGEDGTFTLTLEHGLGQTVYFSDRPEREVGAAPTQNFLKQLGFSADNPPNAALVVEPTAGETDIAVLELFNPRYDESSHTATYDVQVLQDYEKSVEMSFTEAPSDLSQLAAAFGTAHLFIDGCPDAPVTCFYIPSNQGIYTFNGLPFCYWTWYGCTPCAGNGVSHADIQAYWNQHCNDVVADCKGECEASWDRGDQ